MMAQEMLWLRESCYSCRAGHNPERPYLKSAGMESCTAIKSWHPDHAGIAAGDLAYSYIERRERHGWEGNKETFQCKQN